MKVEPSTEEKVAVFWTEIGHVQGPWGEQAHSEHKNRRGQGNTGRKEPQCRKQWGTLKPHSLRHRRPFSAGAPESILPIFTCVFLTMIPVLQRTAANVETAFLGGRAISGHWL